jgi:coenzyme F420-0:L-glutamate ligase/coenzyme F420-1:gamma-L-glutamate ligase
MELFAVHTGMIKTGHNIADTILQSLVKEGLRIESGDIIAVTSKVISVSEGRIVELKKISPSRRALSLSKKYNVMPELTELILREADRIIGGMDGVILTLKDNILLANAGIDRKNAGPDNAVLHPIDSSSAANSIREYVLEKTGRKVGVIVTDTRTQPLRIGTIGVAIGVSGFEPIIDEIGKPDLFSRPLRITKRALADQLATAAEILMGETNECVPAVLIRGAPVTLNDTTTPPVALLVPPSRCFYTKILSHSKNQSEKSGGD